MPDNQGRQQGQRIRQLLEIVERAYSKKSWHGTTLRGSIRGIESDVAFARVKPGRHSISEIVVHTAYWKYAVTRRLTGTARNAFPLKGSNWFPQDVVVARRHIIWKQQVELLGQMHNALVNAISRLGDSDLCERAPGATTTSFDLISGIAAHDLYHAGQIQLIKKLLNRL